MNNDLNEEENRIFAQVMILDAKYKAHKREKKNEYNRRRYANDRQAKLEYQRQYQKTHRDRIRLQMKQYHEANRDHWNSINRARRFNISHEEIANMLLVQKTCEICGVEFGDDRSTKAHIDHDHVSGEVRGLLCQRCNIGIGHFKDDPDRLQAAIDYLERNQPARYYG